MPVAYYTAGPRAREIIEEAMAGRRAYNERVEKLKAELQEELGIEGFFVRGLEPVGMKMPGDTIPRGDRIPHGLRQCSKHPALGMFVPNRKTKKGKELAKRMDLGRYPSGRTLACALVKDCISPFGIVLRDGRITGVGIERLGDQVVVSAKHNPDQQPYELLDCTLMKASEYWLLREAADEAVEENS